MPEKTATSAPRSQIRFDMNLFRAGQCDAFVPRFVEIAGDQSAETREIIAAC